VLPLLGFAPDADPATPGVITDCTNLIPYLNGMEGGPTGTTPSDVPVLSSACLGAAVVTKLDGTRRIIAGTAEELFELSSGSWSDVSGTTYAATADFRWSFAQFGDATLAANKGDVIQRSTSGAFADADASAPSASIVFTVGAQVMALDVNDGADKPDGWHCCAINDDTDWTPSLTTRAASGRLVSTPGPLTAGARLGDYAIAYKSRSIYIGQFVDAPEIWHWESVQGGDAGCVGKDALCDLGGAHFFVGEDNFWLFDGTRPIPLANNQVRQWFFDNSSPEFRYRTQCVYDRQNDRVWVFYPSNSAETCDSALVYHIKTKQWGRSDRTCEATLNYISAGLTYDTWDDAGSTYDTLPDIAYDSQFWRAGGRALAVVNASHQLQMLTGASAASGFVTGDVGDDDQYSLLTGVRLRFAPGFKPETGLMRTFHKANSGDDYEMGPGALFVDGKFDVLVESRWHKAEFTFTGPVRVTAGAPKVKPAGDR
jgi:hypothetical protein